jgi:hypothetical protein
MRQPHTAAVRAKPHVQVTFKLGKPHAAAALQRAQDSTLQVTRSRYEF